MAAPRLVDYARFHSIAVDHTTQDLPSHLELLSSPSKPDEEDVVLPEFKISEPSAQPFLNEPNSQLTDSETDILNRAINRPTQIDWKAFLPNHKKVAMLKLDMPTLRSNHVRDMAQLRQQPNKKDLLSLVGSDEMESKACAQERWKWFQGVDQAGQLIREELRREKITITKEALIWTVGVTRNAFEDSDLRKVYAEDLQLHKETKIVPLTPILMPETDEDDSDFSFSNDVAKAMAGSNSSNVPITPTAEPEDMNLRIHQQVLDEMMAQDAMSMTDRPNKDQQKIDMVLTKATSTPDWNFREIAGPQDQPDEHILGFVNPMTLSKRSETMELNVEVPHCPVSHSMSKAPWKRSDEADSLHADVTTSVELQLWELPSESIRFTPELDDIDFDTGSEQLDHHFLALSQKEDKKWTERLTSEKVEDPTLLTHTDVPKLDKIRFEPPWTGFADHEQKQRFVLDHTAAIQLELLVSNAEHDKKLNWVPFPINSTTTDVRENFEDSTRFVHTAITPPKVCMRSEQMLWRSGKLKVLENDESDDEIEEDVYSMAETDGQLVIPVKRRLDEPANEVPATHDLSVFERDTQWSPAVRSSKSAAAMQSINGRPSVLGSTFSASGALANFLDLRGQKFKKQRHAKASVVASDCAEDPIESTQLEALRTRVDHEYTGSRVQVPATPIPRRVLSESTYWHPWPRPSQTPLDMRKAIILSNTLLSTHRNLVSFLENYGAEEGTGNRAGHRMLKIIYRDPPSRKLLMRTPSSKILPDIALSPTVAVLFTTLQALSQRPLPGQSTSENPVVHGRILDMIEDYEKVFILVTHCPATSPSICGGTTSLTDNECRSWTVFRAFCASVKESFTVSPLLILNPGGLAWDGFPKSRDEEAERGGDALHCCTWTLIHKHGFSLWTPDTAPTTLVQEDTLWLLFLKHCGLNEFAAQVVLSMLSCDQQAVQTWNCGLRRFVRMTLEERLRVFAKVLGTRAVNRVSQILDQSWQPLQAANESQRNLKL